MISDYFQWRKSIKLVELYLNYYSKEKYKLELIFPHEFQKLTKVGYPIYMKVMGICCSQKMVVIQLPFF